MKPGYKTTEFWLTAIAMVIGLVAFIITQGNPDSAWIGRLAFIGGMLPTPVYSVGRASEKKAAMAAGAAVRKAEIEAGLEPEKLKAE